MGKFSSSSSRPPHMRLPPGVNRIRTISIVGGFLDDITFDFTDGLNCIIGARGTDKTTVLELARFAFDAMPNPNTDLSGRRRLDPLIAANLDGGRVQVTIDTKDGLSYIVSRSAGEDAIVLSADGSDLRVIWM